MTKPRQGFESRVILDGSQTPIDPSFRVGVFESRVVLDGSQTVVASNQVQELFESRVTLSENRINE